MKIIWNWLFQFLPYNIFMILWFGKKKKRNSRLSIRAIWNVDLSENGSQFMVLTFTTSKSYSLADDENEWNNILRHLWTAKDQNPSNCAYMLYQQEQTVHPSSISWILNLLGGCNYKIENMTNFVITPNPVNL